jgi:hypothetical protein
MLVKVFCITKNEYDLIEDFIKYYGYLFGYSNIIIIDNMSDHPIVLEIYDKYKELGVIIHQEKSYQGGSQGINFTNYMFRYRNHCKFLLGIDTDEFLFSTKHLEKGLNPFLKEHVLEAFNNIPEDVTQCHISKVFNSIVDPKSPFYKYNKIIFPAKNITTFYEENIGKTKNFYKSSAFISTDMGNHDGKVKFGKKDFVNLGFLHMHDTGSRRQFERSEMAVIGFKYINIDLPLEEKINVLFNRTSKCYGYHRVKEYRNFLLSFYIVEMFLLYIKRLPNIEELQQTVKIMNNMSTLEITNEFKIFSNKIFITPSVTQTEKENLVFYDKPLSQTDKKIYVLDFLTNILKNI